MNELSLFSGYGGFNLGFQLAGLKVRTVGYVEWEKYPQEIIKARIKDGYIDDAPIFADIRAFDGTQYRGLVDIVTGGFPCQPHSVAGQRQGEADERNMWPDTARVIDEVRPHFILLENVPGILSGDAGRPPYGGTVIGELSTLGYDCQWGVVGARDAGAPHKRERWWCLGVAHSDAHGRLVLRRQQPEQGEEAQSWFGKRGGIYGEQLAHSISTGISGRDQRRLGATRPETGEQQDGQGATNQLGDRGEAGNVGDTSGTSPTRLTEFSGGIQEAEGGVRSGASEPSNRLPAWPPSPSDRDGWARVLAERPELAPALTKEAESEFRGVAHGNPHRVDRLKALGNGIVSPVVREFLRRI